MARAGRDANACGGAGMVTVLLMKEILCRMSSGRSRGRRGLMAAPVYLSAVATLIPLSGDCNFKSLRILWHPTHLMTAHQNRST